MPELVSLPNIESVPEKIAQHVVSNLSLKACIQPSKQPNDKHTELMVLRLD